MRPLLLAIFSSGEFDAPSQIVVQSPTFCRNALQLGFVARNASAQAYSVEIRPTLNDLEVKIEQVPQRSLLIIGLTNNESTRVRCVLNCDASPQTPRRSTRTINPGETISSVFHAQRR